MTGETPINMIQKARVSVECGKGIRGRPRETITESLLTRWYDGRDVTQSLVIN